MIRLSFIFGTRPEAIKLVPLVLLAKSNSNFLVEICTTGQHKEMLKQVLQLFNLTPDFDLDLMTDNQSLSHFLGRSIVSIDKYLYDNRPDYVVVQGDTSSVLSAALSSFYNKIKVLHVEAGLRTNDLYSPYPEEMNRRLTSQLTYFHFAPTSLARANLLAEGVSSDRISVTGNTSIDALLAVVNNIHAKKIEPILDLPLIEAIKGFKKMVLITGHRRENFGEGFKNICDAIKKSAFQNPECLFVYPVHLNPNVKEVVGRTLSGISNIILTKPQGYVEFIYLMMKCDLILTDSGGVQEEAPSLKKPILVMRENTERPEGLEVGCSKLVGTNVSLITEEINKLLNNNEYYNSFLIHDNPYGTGNASKLILSKILEFHGN